MTDLILYDQACTAIERACNVDEVRDVMNKADAIRHYARQAKNRELEIRCAKIRMRAERRLGQLRAADKTLGRVAKGGRPYQNTTGADTEQVDLPPTLEELGIDRKLSARADKMAALPAERFETLLAGWEDNIRAENDRVTTDLLRNAHKEQQAQSRRNLAQALADTSDQLLVGRKVPCIYADPAYAQKGGIGDRAYENHYPTEKWEGVIEIMKKAATRLQPDGWAFIWIPRAHMLALHPVEHKVMIDDGSIHLVAIKIPLIWAIARALGCDDYSTCFVWTKTDEDHEHEHGTFRLARDQDEILCLYKKGAGLPKPPPENIYGSNHRERSRPLGHSVKPPFYRKLIADMVGTDSDGRPLPVLEMFCRHDEASPLPENWEAWGNESMPEVRNVAHETEMNIPENIPEQAESSVNPIPQEASGTAREAPGGSSLGEPSVVAASSQEADAAGEAGSRPRLRSSLDADDTADLDEPPGRQALSNAEADPDREAGFHGGSSGPDHDAHRWEDDGGGPVDLPDRFTDDLVIVKRPAVVAK